MHMHVATVHAHACCSRHTLSFDRVIQLSAHALAQREKVIYTVPSAECLPLNIAAIRDENACTMTDDFMNDHVHLL